MKLKVFSARDFRLIESHQIELKTITDKGAGWVEMDAWQIVESVQECIEQVGKKLNNAGYSTSQIKGLLYLKFWMRMNFLFVKKKTKLVYF